MPVFSRALLLIALALPVPASAQDRTPHHAQPSQMHVGPSGQKPYVPPWDKALRRFYERELQRLNEREKLLLRPDPYARSERAVRRLYDEYIRKLGLPENRPIQTDPAGTEPAAPPPLPDEVLALDSDHDGVVTRREYMEHRFRHRPVAAGPAIEARRRSYQGRASSRFNGVDRDGDDRLTTEELRGVRDPRF